MATPQSARSPGTVMHPHGTTVDKHVRGNLWDHGEIVEIKKVCRPDGLMDWCYKVKYNADNGREEQLMHWEVEERILNKQRLYSLGTRVDKHLAGNRWCDGDIVDSSETCRPDGAMDWCYKIRYAGGEEEILDHDEVAERILHRMNGTVP